MPDRQWLRQWLENINHQTKPALANEYLVGAGAFWSRFAEANMA